MFIGNESKAVVLTSLNRPKKIEAPAPVAPVVKQDTLVTA